MIAAWSSKCGVLGVPCHFIALRVQMPFSGPGGCLVSVA